MESGFKQRLTGASVLMLFVVIVVPELYHGQGERGGGATGVGDGPPVRTYTIDVSGGAPAPSSPPAVPAHPVEPAHAAVAPTGTPALSAPGATKPMSAGPAPSAQPVPAPAQAPTSVVAPVPTGPVGPAAGGTGRWSVQLGIFSVHDNAARLAATVRSRGFAASVSGADARGMHRVRIDGLPDRAAAERMVQQLKAAGFAGAVQAP